MNSGLIAFKIPKKEAFLVLTFYVFMTANYFVALVIDTGFLNHYWTVSLNHFLKALLTIPFWWFFFRTIASFPIWKKALIHLVAFPVFTFIWIFIYYELCDLLGLFRLQDSRRIWDFYLTALFYIIQFGNFHLYDYYRKLKEQQVLSAQLRQLTLQSELSALKAQLNPHFLYNVFNTINASIPASAERTRNMIAKLSDLFRYQLKASKEEMITVKEELDFVRKYLDLEKERFGERLNYEINVDDDVLEDQVPPIILQPIVENSVKHGLSSLMEGGRVAISIKKEVDWLNVEISDTGVGISNEKKDSLLKRGVGLSNTNDRLEKMYGRGLELTDNQPSGLIVKFSIPLKEEVAFV